MNNTLTDLNNALFAEIESLQDTDNDEQLEKVIRRSKAVGEIASVIIHNGELALKTMQHLNEYGYGSRPDAGLAHVPEMLEARK